MKKSKFTDEQIADALRQVENRSVADALLDSRICHWRFTGGLDEQGRAVCAVTSPNAERPLRPGQCQHGKVVRINARIACNGNGRLVLPCERMCNDVFLAASRPLKPDRTYLIEDGRVPSRHAHALPRPPRTTLQQYSAIPNATAPRLRVSHVKQSCRWDGRSDGTCLSELSARGSKNDASHHVGPAVCAVPSLWACVGRPATDPTVDGELTCSMKRRLVGGAVGTSANRTRRCRISAQALASWSCGMSLVRRCVTCGQMGIEVPDASALDVLVQCLRAGRTNAMLQLVYKRGRWRVSGMKRGHRRGSQ